MKYVTIYHDGNGKIEDDDIIVDEMNDKEIEVCNNDFRQDNDIVAIIPLSSFTHLLPHLTKAKSHYVNKVEVEFKTDDGEDDSEIFEVGDCENFDEGSLPWSREIVKIKVLE